MHNNRGLALTIGNLAFSTGGAQLTARAAVQSPHAVIPPSTAGESERLNAASWCNTGRMAGLLFQHQKGTQASDQAFRAI